MKSLPAYRKNKAEKEYEAWKQKQAEEEARVAAMSPEERKAYEADKAKRRIKTAQLLGLMSSITGPYSDPNLWR